MSRVAIVTGMIGTVPVGGVAWDYGQYVLGMEQLGFEVYYLEDTGWASYRPETKFWDWDDVSHGVEFLQRSLSAMSPGMAGRWHLRAWDGATYGMSPEAFAEVLERADVFLNVSGSAMLRTEYQRCRNTVLLDTDPGKTHFVSWNVVPEESKGIAPFSAHEHFATYAERLGQPGCVLPDFGRAWHPTRPPVVLDRWAPEPPAERWTTVMTWSPYFEPMEYAGRRYGNKQEEFAHVATLPRQVDASFEVAVSGDDVPWTRLADDGWSTAPAESVSRTADDYRDYIQRSRGEFSVAKNVYVATRSGWFSCRSVCYLAAGRPVVVQDTGFAEVVPTGAGLHAFHDLAGAAAAIKQVEADYAEQCGAARSIAEEHFAAETVLADLLNRIGV